MALKEFLIRPVHAKWFELSQADWPLVMHPNTVPYRAVSGWGNYRITVEGVEISFSDEDPGIQVTFYGELPADVTDSIVKQIVANIKDRTGEESRIVEL